MPDSTTDYEDKTYDCEADRLAIHLATILQNHPELPSVVESWPELPEPVRAGILAMVKAANGETNER